MTRLGFISALIAASVVGAALSQTTFAAGRVDGRDIERDVRNVNEKAMIRAERLREEHEGSHGGSLPRDADLFEHTHEQHEKWLRRQQQ